MSDEHNPFRKLGKQYRKPKPAPEPEQQAKKQENDFASAMQDVYSLGDPRGRKNGSGDKENDDGLHNPFAGLAVSKDENKTKPMPEKKRRPPKQSKPEKSTPARADAEQTPDSDEDEQYFLRAMQGATPLKGKGRSVAPAPATQPAKTSGPDTDAEVMEELNRLVNGDIQFDLEFSEEYMHGHIKDLDSMIFQKLKNGRFSFESHIDLHGMNVEQAGLALIDFIREQYLKGSRCVLVVHGRGMNSPQGRSVLKHEVQRWLTRDPLRRVVLAFVTALPRHGGPGSIYVLLRRYKKTKGKVMWDRLPPDLSYPD